MAIMQKKKKEFSSFFQKMKKIMVIMPIDPVSIITNSKELIDFCSGKVDWYCPQVMALLNESIKNQSYLTSNILFSTAIKDNFEITFEKNSNYEFLVMFGNCDKDTTKFDHIITVEEWWNEDNKDLYIENLPKIYETKINWFKYEDAEHSFPTVQHLKIFLKAQGVKDGTV